jgi:hypothetical protein
MVRVISMPVVAMISDSVAMMQARIVLAIGGCSWRISLRENQ